MCARIRWFRATLAIGMATATLAGSTPMVAQTPLGTQNLSHPEEDHPEERLPDIELNAMVRGIAPNNPWIGAQVSYRFGEGGEFADNLLVSGRLIHKIDLGTERFHLPVMGNIAPLIQTASDLESDAEKFEDQVEQILLSATGATAGLYPYYIVRGSEVFTLTVHGVAAWRLNALAKLDSEEDERVYLNQGKFAAGVEFLIGKRDPKGGGMLTLSLAPALTLFHSDAYEEAFGESRSSFASLEMTGILPFGNGVGLVLEGVIAEDSHEAVRAGIMVANEIE